MGLLNKVNLHCTPIVLCLLGHDGRKRIIHILLILSGDECHGKQFFKSPTKNKLWHSDFINLGCLNFFHSRQRLKTHVLGKFFDTFETKLDFCKSSPEIISCHNLSSGIADNSWVAMEIRVYPKKNGWILRRQTVFRYWELAVFNSSFSKHNSWTL